MSTPRLFAVDWGTTALRCYAVASDGAITARHEAADGILAVTDGDFAGVLRSALQQIGGGDEKAPVLMSGMIGSKQGWVEAPYVSCPSGLDALAARLMTIDTDLDHSVALVPGLSTRTADGVPDVIRGEETQIFGALATIGQDNGQDHGQKNGLFVLPGTHSKWVTVRDGAIRDFQTYMTGEVFAALKDHTILGRLMSGDDLSPDHFEAGVRAARSTGAPGDLLHQIFSARTLGLFDQVPSEGIAGYLSGLLIGSELQAAINDHNQPLFVIAGSTLAALYVSAAETLGVVARTINSDCIVHGHLTLANAAGIAAVN